MKTFNTLAELAALAGQEITVTDWYEVTQQHINQFADATGDHSGFTSMPSGPRPGPSAPPSRTAT